MSRYLDGTSVAAFAGNRSFAWSALRKRLLAGSVSRSARIWLKRWRDRRELLDYLAMDHRAAADLGIDRSNAREWAQRPFWRA